MSRNPTPTALPTRTNDGAHQAFLLLRTIFTVAPILFGLDKFFNVLVDWEQYLAPWIDDIVPGDAGQAMLAVRALQIGAGVPVALRPPLRGYVVAGWLTRVSVNPVPHGQ